MIDGDKLSWEPQDLSDGISSDLEVVQFRSGQISSSKGVGFENLNTFGCSHFYWGQIVAKWN